MFNARSNAIEFLHSQEKGQSMVEYALIIAFIAVVVLVSLSKIGPLIRDIFLDLSGNF